MTALRAALLFLLLFAPAAWGQSSYSEASQPLGSLPDLVFLNQGSGCPTFTLPCATVWSSSLRFGQPIQATCSALLTPFPYQQCIDTSYSPAVLREFIGATWYPVATLDPSNGYLPIGGGGGGGSIGGPGASTINEPALWANTSGTLLKDGLNVSIAHTGNFSISGTLSVGAGFTATNATLITPNIGVATATSINGIATPTGLEIHQNGGCTSGAGANFVIANCNVDVAADHISVQTQDASQFESVAITGSATATDVVGLTWTIASTAYDIRYTVQAGDTLTTIATNLASCINAGSGTHCAVTSGFLAALLAFHDANGFGYFPQAASGGATFFIDAPWGTDNSVATYASGGASETLTLSGGILDNGPVWGCARWVPGRTPVAGDYLCNMQLTGASTSASGLDTQYANIAVNVLAQDATNPQGQIFFAVANGSSAKNAKPEQYIGNGVVFADANGTNCGYLGLGIIRYCGQLQSYTSASPVALWTTVSGYDLLFDFSPGGPGAQASFLRYWNQGALSYQLGNTAANQFQAVDNIESRYFLQVDTGTLSLGEQTSGFGITLIRNGGLQVGAPTGGDCGVGCVNTVSLKVSGGQLTSTIASGTAPFVVASTTNIPNLNASSLSGATFAAPGAIGGGTASTGKFTTVTATTYSGLPVATNAALGVAECDGTTTTCAAGVITAIGGTATSVTVGTTTITSGTTLGLLYDNAGVLGNLATANNGVLVTSSGGVPSISTTLPSGLTVSNITLITPALGTPSAGVLTHATGLPVSTGIAGFGTGVATALAVNTGSAGAFVVNGGALGTPSAGTLTNATGLPISTGVSGLGTGVATLLGGTASGSGGPAGTTSPTFVTPVLGAATGTSLNVSGSVTAATYVGLPVASASVFGIAEVDNVTITASGGVISAVGGSATNIAIGTTTTSSGTTQQLIYDLAGVVSEITKADSSVLVSSASGVPSWSTTLPSGLAATNLTLTTPALGTPTAGVLTNATGLPIATGVSGLGTGVATLLAGNSSGTGGPAGTTSPTFTTPNIGTASGASLTVTGQLTSTVAIGTAPLVVTSTTNVPNLNATTLSGATFAAPGPVGSTTASTGAFTTLSASSTVSGTGFSTYLASPPAIGGTAAAAGTFTTMGATSLALGGATIGANALAVTGTVLFNTPLSLASGGTAASLTASNGGIFYSTASAGAILAGTATAGLPLLSGSSTTPTWGSDANLAYLDVAQAWTKPQRTNTETPAISTSTFTPVFSTGQNHRIVLIHADCPCTLANPAAIVAGQSGVIEIVQSSTGGDVIGTWGSEYEYAGGTASITLSAGASVVDYLPYYVDSAGTHIVLWGLNQGPAH